MNDFNGMKEPIAFVDGETDEKLTAEDKKNLGIARAFLGGVQPEPGLRLAVYRLHPGWIPGGTGWIETADFSDVADTIMEYIRESYGGGTYVLKVLNRKGQYLSAQNIKIAGDPKYHGRTISQLEAEAMLRPIGPPPSQSPPPENDAIKMLMQNATDSQRETLKLLVSMWQGQKPQSGPTAMEEFIKMMKMVKEMQEGAIAPAATDDNSGALAGIVALVTQFMQNQQQQQTQIRSQMTAQPISPQRPARHFFSNPPAEIKKNPAPMPIQGVEPAIAPAATTQQIDPGMEKADSDTNDIGDDGDGDEGEYDDLSAEIASYSVDEIVSLVGDVFRQMDPEKVAEVVKKMSAV